MESKKILLLIIVLTIASQGLAQVPSTGGGNNRSEKDFRFLPIPYLNYSRSIGFSYGLIPMAMYNLGKQDTISPSSITGGLIMGTTNGTWFGMGFGKWFLKEDTWRITMAGGVGNVNYQFYPDLPLVPEVVEYTTGADFFMLEVQRKVIKSMYAGMGLIYAHLETDFDLGPIPAPTQTTDLTGLRFVYAYDGRDDVYYPHQGQILNFSFNTFPEFVGNSNGSNRIQIDYNQYYEMPNQRDMVAARVFLGIGLGELDFNQQFIVGGTDLRGYSQGEFRGEQLYAFQGEYRWNIANRFGLVGFAGVATVFGSQNEKDNGRLLPAAGGGFRITAFKKNHMNFGLDAGVGIRDWGIEFRIGEAF